MNKKLIIPAFVFAGLFVIVLLAISVGPKITGKASTTQYSCEWTWPQKVIAADTGEIVKTCPHPGTSYCNYKAAQEGTIQCCSHCSGSWPDTYDCTGCTTYEKPLSIVPIPSTPATPSPVPKPAGIDDSLAKKKEAGTNLGDVGDGLSKYKDSAAGTSYSPAGTDGTSGGGSTGTAVAEYYCCFNSRISTQWRDTPCWAHEESLCVVGIPELPDLGIVPDGRTCNQLCIEAHDINGSMQGIFTGEVDPRRRCVCGVVPEEIRPDCADSDGANQYTFGAVAHYWSYDYSDGPTEGYGTARDRCTIPLGTEDNLIIEDNPNGGTQSESYYGSKEGIYYGRTDGVRMTWANRDAWYGTPDSNACYPPDCYVQEFLCSGGSDCTPSHNFCYDIINCPNGCRSGACLSTLPDKLNVFVSSEKYTGNLGGLTGADAKCQALADAAGLTGTYKAWLSTATVYAKNRITLGNAPYYLADDTTKVADNLDDLIDGSLDHAIDRDENGMYRTGEVWTGTDWNGVTYVSSGYKWVCTDWTSAFASGPDASSGASGLAHRDTGLWTFAVGDGCSNRRRIYCFQDSVGSAAAESDDSPIVGRARFDKSLLGGGGPIPIKELSTFEKVKKFFFG